MAATNPRHLRVFDAAEADTLGDELAQARDRHPATRAWSGPLTEREADIAEDLRGYDAGCRYAADPARYPTHVCSRNTGEPVRLGETCHFEAHVQLDEQRRCTTCGHPIAAVGGRGSVTMPDGRTFRFHAGDCFLRADAAIAALDAAGPGPVTA